MAAVSVEYVNLFLMAATKILKEMCQVEAVVGKPTLRDTAVTENSIVITVGLIGEMKGQVMLDLSFDIACDIASKMCMRPVTEMDELSQSAISELGNMIMGNAATLFSTRGILVDITTPKLSQGGKAFAGGGKNLCVPITYEENKMIDFVVSIEE